MVERRKIAMLGASGVGKTSLVSRFVRSIFSDVYRTTIGVAIDKRRVQALGRELDLVIWDLSGEDEFQRVILSYLRGASGLLVVVDGTRLATVETALHLHRAAREVVPEVPSVFVLNKADLVATWELDQASLAALEAAASPLVATSARTGAGVEEAFSALTRAMIGDHPRAARGA